MTSRFDLMARVEGSLLDPRLTPAEAVARLRFWEGLGLAHVIAPPGLLATLEPETHPGVSFAGAVAFPSGGATLANKRMELLECVRLGAKAATAVLSPGLVLSSEVLALEKEMVALLSTAPELQVRFLVDVARVPEGPMTLLLRLLKSCRPSHLVPADGVYSTPCGPAEVARLRARLPRKVRVMALADPQGPDEASAYLDSGADMLCTARPERLVEAVP